MRPESLARCARATRIDCDVGTSFPAYGPVGTCADIAAFAHYFAALESRVETLMKDGVSLAELRDRCDLPEFARWDQYETLHPQNANHTYLRLERSQFE